jgi:hypothetical protein
MWEFPKSHSQFAFPRVGVMIVQGAKPAQIVVEIVGGDAVKALNPLLETAVIGIDVLDMNRAFDTHAFA